MTFFICVCSRTFEWVVLYFTSGWCIWLSCHWSVTNRTWVDLPCRSHGILSDEKLNSCYGHTIWTIAGILTRGWLHQSLLGASIPLFRGQCNRRRQESPYPSQLHWYTYLCPAEDLLTPTPPGDKPFAKITAALQNHFEPKRSLIAERLHFHKREQGKGETIAEFDAALRKLAVHCQFGETLEASLRDRFVCGLCHNTIQRWLLSETTLTYHKALEIARGMDRPTERQRFLSRQTQQSIKLGTRSQKSRVFQSCHHCGRSNYKPADCKFKDVQCHSCGKTWHIAPVCRSRPLQSKKGRAETHHLQDDEQSSDDAANSDSEFLLYKVGSRSSDPISVPMLLEVMEVDTGTALSVISESTRQSVFPEEPLHPSKLILKTYTDEQMELDNLEHQGIITPVAHSEWAAPIAVPKSDGKFRICGDYKVMVNQALAVDEYPFPTPKELFSNLARDRIFSKLDLSQVYLQLPVESHGWKQLSTATSGQKGLTKRSKLWGNLANLASLTSPIPLWHLYIPGYGQAHRGSESMWTSRDPFLVTCYL